MTFDWKQIIGDPAMTKSLTLPIILILAFTSMSCEQSVIIEEYPYVLRDLTRPELQLVESDNAFGMNLFKAIVEARADSNVFISPFSIAMALGMTMNGAAGNTYEEMKNTLEFQGLSEDDINGAFRSLIDLFTILDPEVVFEIANSIWVRLGYPVLQDFLDVNQTYFDAEIRELDFSLAEALDIINGWIADQTHGRIEEVLDRIDPSVVMYLINAIYFKGNWTYRFDESETVDAQFTLPDGSRVPCEMMRMQCDLDYFQGPGFQAVDLPYGNGQFSMTVLLPDPGTTVDEIAAQITPQTWDQWMGNFEETAVDIGLPRFTLEWEMLLNDILKGLGMTDAFGAGADFTRINPAGNLYISRVIHKTFVEVNEEGTEAAAVTVVEMREFSTPHMTMNRPFLFVIRENHSGTLLFMGKLVNPSEG